MIVKEQGWE